jgi:carbon-monoxide dehydrogenase medium subunit
LPTLSVSVCLELNEREDRFQSARIVAAPVGPVPWRARKAEASMTGANLSTESIHWAAALAREEANPRSSLRGSSTYRKDMVEVLTKRALIDALSQLNKVLYA